VPFKREFLEGGKVRSDSREERASLTGRLSRCAVIREEAIVTAKLWGRATPFKWREYLWLSSRKSSWKPLELELIF